MKNYYHLVTFAIIFTTSVVTGQLIPIRQTAPKKKNATELRLIIYSGPSEELGNAKVVPLDEPFVVVRSINRTKPFVLYTHGFREGPSNKSVKTMVEVHLKRGTDNIVVLDWSDFSFGNYIIVAARIPDIARAVARALERLVQLGVNLKTLHLVGHSLGAQISGLAGKYSLLSIPRITGLDPAKPGFDYPGAEHIDSFSAEFVDIIHTDGGVYGVLNPTGDADFYANTGSRPQPGCYLIGPVLSAQDLCSHWRSWEIYAESVLNERAFPAVECNSYTNFARRLCLSKRRAYVGYGASPFIHGKFYFATNDRFPLGLTMSGLNFANTFRKYSVILR